MIAVPYLPCLRIRRPKRRFKTVIAERIPEIANLTAEEKLLLANELWAEVENRQESIPFNDAVVQLLDQRSEEFLKDPQSAVTWQEFKRRIGKA